MTLQIMSDHVYTQLGVAISVTGIAQARTNAMLLLISTVLIFCRAISAAYAVVRCPSVCPFVTFIYSVEMSKHILKLFSLSARPTILVFLYQRTKPYGNIPTGTALTGASNAGRVGKNRDSRPISGFRIDDWSSVY